ncbi:MAG: hypothetical protein EPO41_04720 [Reyranella sp.]|uniref:hypothetical protein n=1 Tax=Reyranella sp. TaxID=1929291 RepID=UPI0011F8374B|nr:hypothetical protein [Reyranella sp.]TAJ96997.1 MAG: hypothetical protein EPO41_04720 [Reyranella sp.]
MSTRTQSMAFNIISFIQRATGGAVPVADDQPLPVTAGKETPLLQAQIPSLSGATGLPTIPATAMRVLVQAEVQNVRFRDDGTNPTASVGMQILAGQTIEYAGDLSAIKFIEVAAGAVLNVAYYK